MSAGVELVCQCWQKAKPTKIMCEQDNETCLKGDNLTNSVVYRKEQKMYSVYVFANINW